MSTKAREPLLILEDAAVRIYVDKPPEGWPVPNGIRAYLEEPGTLAFQIRAKAKVARAHREPHLIVAHASLAEEEVKAIIQALTRWLDGEERDGEERDFDADPLDADEEIAREAELDECARERA